MVGLDPTIHAERLADAARSLPTSRSRPSFSRDFSMPLNVFAHNLFLLNGKYAYIE